MSVDQNTLDGSVLSNIEETNWLKQWATKSEKPQDIINEAVEHFTIKYKRKPDKKPTFWVSSSGGNDSMVTADILDKMGLLEGVYHIHIPGGIKSTFEFLENTCKEKGWRFEYRMPYPKYLMVALMLETGCPSYFLHPMYMGFLKQKTTERFVHEKEFRESNIVLVTGIRKFESEKRFGTFKYPIQEAEKHVQYVCPIFYWKDTEKYEYTLKNDIKAAPAKKMLGHSGECPCGSFAHNHEAIEWQKLDGMSAHYIKWIEYGIRHFGTKTAKKYSKWGGQGMTETEAQTFLDSNFTKDEQISMQMAEAINCGTECGPSTMRGDLDF